MSRRPVRKEQNRWSRDREGGEHGGGGGRSRGPGRPWSGLCFHPFTSLTAICPEPGVEPVLSGHSLNICQMNSLMPSTITNNWGWGGEGREEATYWGWWKNREEEVKARETSHEAADSRTSGSLCFSNQPQPVNIWSIFSLTDPQEHRSGMRKMFRSWPWLRRMTQWNSLQMSGTPSEALIKTADRTPQSSQGLVFNLSE